MPKKKKKRKDDLRAKLKLKSARQNHPIKKRKMQKAAEALAKRLTKKLKIEVVTHKQKNVNIECISTGFQALDDVVSGRLKDGSGDLIKSSGLGFPRGRIVEIYGPEAAAKTTLSLCVVAEAQRRGEVCTFIDAEHALDPNFARDVVGVDVDSLIWTQPDDGEEAMETLKMCVREGVSVIVVDSVAALVSRAELDGGRALGEQARLMSKTCRELTTALKPGGPCIIFLNQIRYKIGVVFGNPEMTSGGNALKFYASVRVTVRKKKDLKKPGRTKGEPIVIGTRFRMNVIKNKIAPTVGRGQMFDLLFGKGVRIPKTMRVIKDEE